MITINVLNIEGKTVLPIRGDGKTESFAAGYDVVATDHPFIVGEVGNEVTLDDGTKITLYKSIDYIEYHTALKVQPVTNEYGEYHYLDLRPRSSVRKYNLVLANSMGLIDNDYRGEILVSYKYIFQPEDFTVSCVEEDGKGYQPVGLMAGVNWTKIYHKGDKIAQLVASKTNECQYTFVSELAASTRGEGGHGSTGQQATPTPLKSEQQHSTILDAYSKAGGVLTKKRYIDEVREREYLAEQTKPRSSNPILPKTGIQERP